MHHNTITKIPIGYNKRTRFLSYSDDEHGNGRVTFRPNYKTKAPALDSWAELFKKYPSGLGHIKDKNKNKNLQISLYDNQKYGKRYMDEFKKKEMQTYINGLGGTYSYKRHCLSARTGRSIARSINIISKVKSTRTSNHYL